MLNHLPCELCEGLAYRKGTTFGHPTQNKLNHGILVLRFKSITHSPLANVRFIFSVSGWKQIVRAEKENPISDEKSPVSQLCSPHAGFPMTTVTTTTPNSLTKKAQFNPWISDSHPCHGPSHDSHSSLRGSVAVIAADRILLQI